jgi:hypothetical protein
MHDPLLGCDMPRTGASMRRRTATSHVLTPRPSPHTPTGHDFAQLASYLTASVKPGTAVVHSLSFGKLNPRPTTPRTHLAVSSPFSSHEPTPPPKAHGPSLLAIWPTGQNPLASVRFLKLPCRIMRRISVSYWSLTHPLCNFRVATLPNLSLPPFWPSVNSKEAIES